MTESCSLHALQKEEKLELREIRSPLDFEELDRSQTSEMSGTGTHRFLFRISARSLCAHSAYQMYAAIAVNDMGFAADDWERQGGNCTRRDEKRGISSFLQGRNLNCS